MSNRKNNLTMGLVLLFFFGLLSLFRILTNLRVATLHGSDIVTMTGCSAYLGIALMALLDSPPSTLFDVIFVSASRGATGEK